MKYKDPKELIGLEIIEGEKLYKITGIGKITDEYMTIYTEPINIIEKELLNELQKIDRFKLLGIDTTTNEVKRDQLIKRLEELSKTSSE